ncbi:hypothetical protein TRIUR3_15052 [Triticum urartu]|uniref:Uncharacterized protein n=1 Tax=Triticum urartu TaxID=4572 RepID=M7ZN36_TRIUA|nr:hypothetical protein TRIUR3_15052 [Triticum urartu]
MRRKRSVVELFAAVPRVAGDDGRKVKRKLDKGKQPAGAQAKKGPKKDKAPAEIAARKKVRFFFYFYQARICITWVWIGMRLLGIFILLVSGGVLEVLAALVAMPDLVEDDDGPSFCLVQDGWFAFVMQTMRKWWHRVGAPTSLGRGPADVPSTLS